MFRYVFPMLLVVKPRGGSLFQEAHEVAVDAAVGGDETTGLTKPRKSGCSEAHAL